MQKIIIIIALLLNLLYADILKNDLQYELSPYLKQHETNPVNWMPWGEKAFEKAKKENKPIYLSIGYSTCHWCHVMARESFTNKEIAKKLNKDFISIKVDREELPQVDSYFQEIYQKINKRKGGWPLNIFLTSNKEPFYVSTYLPPSKELFSEGLDTLIPNLANRYKNDYKSILEDVKQIKDSSVVVKGIAKNISSDTLSKSIYESYDEEHSGFGHGRKFPQAAKLSLMMDLAFLNNDKLLLQNSYDMLDFMALRGLYDHIEGGFYRYTSDSSWEIAHFEKMLYNQAELLPIYVRAYNRTNGELYKDVVDETIAMLDKRFLKDALYYSASDTDSSNHKEGDFFVFSVDEVKGAMQNNPYKEEIEDSLDFVMEGNFHGNVHLNFYTKSRPKGFKEFRDDLSKIRENKEYPFIDKKINTAWNSMMIEALYNASFIDKKYKVKADKHLESLTAVMFDKGELHHQTLIGLKPTQKGLLEDYSFFIGALLAGYEIDYDENKLGFAEYLLSRSLNHFYRNGEWYLSNDNMNIRATLVDKYYTSPLSKMLQNIIKLASLKDSFKYERIVVSTLANINHELSVSQSNAPAAARAYLMQSLDMVTIKSAKARLVKDALKIKNIKYPYVLSKKTDDYEYLACTMRRCFSKEEKLDDIIKAIEQTVKK